MEPSGGVRHEEARDGGTRGKFVYQQDASSEPAVLDYVLIGNEIMEITRTLVPAIYRGQGIAAILCEQAFAYAKEKHYKVRPTCSYASGTFLKKPKYSKLYNEIVEQPQARM